MQDTVNTSVKILLSYDIIPETQEGYYQFMLGEMVPRVQSMGLGMEAAWHTAYGNYPNRLVVFVAESREVADSVLNSNEWDEMETRLQPLVENYSRRVVKYQKNKFQF